MRGPVAGHRRPLGTTKRVRIYEMRHEPELGTIAVDDPPEVTKRAYLIVGVEEVGRPGRWNLVLERMDWEAALSSELEWTICMVVKR